MPACVLDASSVFPWLFEDEASPQADALLDMIIQHGAVIPALWYTEIENGIGMAERRNRLSPAGVQEAISLLRGLDLVLDRPDPARAFGATLDLMRTHRLTAYDATYLELAIRSRLQLASNDKELRKAARGWGRLDGGTRTLDRPR
jgi:predicted nucleic acid-binding protein